MLPIISPQGWDYVFLLSTLATMLLINYRAKLPSAKQPATAALMVNGGLAALGWRKVA